MHRTCKSMTYRDRFLDIEGGRTHGDALSPLSIGIEIISQLNIRLFATVDS